MMPRQDRVTHLRVRLVRENAFKQPSGLWTDGLRPLHQSLRSMVREQRMWRGGGGRGGGRQLTYLIRRETQLWKSDGFGMSTCSHRRLDPSATSNSKLTDKVLAFESLTRSTGRAR